MLGGRAERHGRYKQASPWRSSGPVCIYTGKAGRSVSVSMHKHTSMPYCGFHTPAMLSWAVTLKIGMLIFWLISSFYCLILRSKIPTNDSVVEPARHSLVLRVLYHKSMIKSCHVEARQDPGLWCKLWPAPNASLSHPGQNGGGLSLAWSGQRRGSASCCKLKASMVSP